MAHQEFGIRLLERVKTDLLDYAVVEQFPKMEGRQLVMVLSPKKVQLKPATTKVVPDSVVKPASIKQTSINVPDADPLVVNR
jgi:translation initiation factor IF-3